MNEPSGATVIKEKEKRLRRRRKEKEKEEAVLLFGGGGGTLGAGTGSECASELKASELLVSEYLNHDLLAQSFKHKNHDNACAAPERVGDLVLRDAPAHRRDYSYDPSEYPLTRVYELIVGHVPDSLLRSGIKHKKHLEGTAPLSSAAAGYILPEMYQAASPHKNHDSLDVDQILRAINALGDGSMRAVEALKSIFESSHTKLIDPTDCFHTPRFWR